MRAVLQDLEARKHSRGFTENDRIRLLRTRAVDGLLTDTVNLVKNDREAVTYLQWRASSAVKEAAAMQDSRPSAWLPGRRRAVDEQIREKQAMAQEAASFATSISVAARVSASPAPDRAGSGSFSRPAQGRVLKGVRGAGQFTFTTHGEAGVSLGPAAAPAPQAVPSVTTRAGSDRHLKVLDDFLSPLEAAAGGGGPLTPAQQNHLLRGRRVRRILTTAIQGCSSDEQVVQKLNTIKGQAQGQLQVAEASAASAPDRATLAARIQELREVVKDCGSYAGFLTAGT